MSPQAMNIQDVPLDDPDLAPWLKVQRWRDLASILHEGQFTLAELRSRLEAQDHPVSVRTIQRDLSALSLLLGAEVSHTPGPKSDRRFFLAPDQHPIPMLTLSPGEARALLFAIRLLVHNSREHEHDTRTLLDKLGSAFPGIIGTVAAQTIAQIDSLPRENRASRDSRDLTLLQLTQAWTGGSLVSLSYRGVGSRHVSHNWCFQPLLLEPSRSNGGAYVIGFRFDTGGPALRSLRLDRIFKVHRHPEICPKTRLPHPHDDVRTTQAELPKLLTVIEKSWSGIVVSDQHFPVEIRFHGDAVDRAAETRWRSNMQLMKHDDGSLTLKGNFSQWWDLLPWVLSWGSGAEVIQPPELREAVIEHLRTASALYPEV